uniref:Sema domain-containing protein n=1 Tax=Salarias fasciatus TaxID=181472 RepID=A0A672FPH0_SALFA
MPASDWPRWAPPPCLLLLLVLGSGRRCESGSPFPKDLEPLSVVTWQHSSLPSFQGLLQDNDTLRLGLDFQRMLRINHMLYITARDHVFAVNLTTASERFVPQLKLTWKSKDVGKCTVRGKNSDECYNYIKVLVPRDDETLFACGTNAFNPTCRNYRMRSLEQVGEDLVGQARCPFESGQSNVGLFAGGEFYSATMTDFLASDAVIYRSLGDRPVLRTVKYDSKWLREPHFLHAIDYGNYVYFFLREIAVEYTALGKVVFSRVARVCKNDNGGSPRVLERYWTSFLKARLNCSVPGDSFFYFDVLQSLTSVLQLEQRPAVLGVFTTQGNSIPGSAVCSFFLDDVEQVFSGSFKEQRGGDASWTPVPEDQVPSPRPGSCAGDGPAADFKSSVQFPDDMLTFIKSFPLMDGSVPAVNHRPCFTRTASRSKLTQIVADVSAGPFKDRTVLFLGSEDGHVLKVLVSSRPNNTWSSRLLEDIDVYNPSRCDVQGQEDRTVLSLELDKEHHAVFVAFSSCVIRLPLSRCSQHGGCRRSCLASRDPYCIWLRTGSCASAAPGFRSGFEQDVDGEFSSHPDSCHSKSRTSLISSLVTRSSVLCPAGVRRLPDVDQRSAATVHYTLLIACVLVAFFLGAVLSAFTVSCYCGRGSAHRAGRLAKDPEASLSHALSLRSLARLNGLNGLLDGPAKVGGATGVSRRSEGDGELSGLPTPDSTPELPIKSLKALSSSAQHQQQQQQIPETQTFFSSSHHLDPPPGSSASSSSSSSSSSNNPTSSTSIPSSSSSCASTPLQQQVIPERPGGGGANAAARHGLIRMGGGGGRGASHPQHFLDRRPAVCLTRQHSYNGGPLGGRPAAVRRTASLKPQVPPKPLFLPSAAPAPLADAQTHRY